MCTEKDYSGATTSRIGKNAKISSSPNSERIITKTEPKKNENKKESALSEEQIKNYKKAGQIASQVKEYAKTITKKNMPLVEIAEKIEAKIKELNGGLAFPVNLSINDIAAHYTPNLKDEEKAEGLLKVDLGVHINGCICDIAFSLDLTDNQEYSKIIKASEEALKSAINKIKENKEQTQLSEIGREIEKTIKKHGFIPIANLSGHSLENFEIHSGITIPNIDNTSTKELGEGAFAIEPFATFETGSGSIYEGAGSNIYQITSFSQVRDRFAREVFAWIMENKKTLPFSKREIEKEFGSKALFAINNLKIAGIIKEFPRLIEKNHQPISQTETSVIIHNGKVEILVE